MALQQKRLNDLNEIWRAVAANAGVRCLVVPGRSVRTGASLVLRYFGDQYIALVVLASFLAIGVLAERNRYM